MNRIRIIVTLSFLLGIVLSTPSHAWVYSGNVSVVEITQWQGDTPIYFKLSNGTMCYVTPLEKTMYSLMLSLYATGKKAHIHCHDTADTYGGIPGYRIHRVISLPQ